MFSLKIDSSGVENHFKELARAVKALEEPIKLEFNPADPEDVDRVIMEIARTIDERIRPFSRNSAAIGIAEKIKERFHEQVREKAKNALQKN